MIPANTITPSCKSLTARDSERWNTLLPANRSAFGSAAFASVVAEYTGAEGRLFSFRTGDHTVNYPFLVRPLSALPFGGSAAAGEASDIASPEYTGPLATAPLTPETAVLFRETFSGYCRRERIVAEFAHLHPWNCPPDLLSGEGPRPDRELVYVDLAWSEERLWRESYQHSCRKNIKRAQREGVRVFAATEPAAIREFHRVYTGTMKRNNAAQKYFFPVEFFLAIFERMPNNARFALAERQGRIIAGTLYLHDRCDVYSYLGGADHAFQHVRPTNAIIHDTIRWAKNAGKLRLILGGGYRPGDGISRFKATISPLRAQFSTYRKTHLPELYDPLCDAWRRHYGPGASLSGDFFPAYRAVPAHQQSIS